MTHEVTLLHWQHLQVIVLDTQETSGCTLHCAALANNANQNDVSQMHCLVCSETQFGVES